MSKGMNWNRAKRGGPSEAACPMDWKLLQGHANGGKVRRLTREEIDRLYPSQAKPRHTTG